MLSFHGPSQDECSFSRHGFFRLYISLPFFFLSVFIFAAAGTECPAIDEIFCPMMTGRDVTGAGWLSKFTLQDQGRRRIINQPQRVLTSINQYICTVFINCPRNLCSVLMLLLKIEILYWKTIIVFFSFLIKSRFPLLFHRCHL